MACGSPSVPFANNTYMLAGLYVLTDARHFTHASWPDRVERILSGGASMLQLRDKQLTDEELLPIAQTIQEICRAYNAIFIINDRVSLSKKIRADGIHIGKDDQQIYAAREFLGNQYLIGASCYRNLYTATLAQHHGADYVAFGSVFTSSTKQFAPRCSLATIRNAKKLLAVPVCAIGGINDSNIRSALTAGADMIAVCHAVFNAQRPDLATNKLMQQVILSRQHSS